MATGADAEQSRPGASRDTFPAQSRRTQAKIFLAMAPLWVVIAVARWVYESSDPVTRWLFTALALGQLVNAAVWWRVLRRPSS